MYKKCYISFLSFLLYTYTDITPYTLYKENNFLYQNSRSHSGHFYLYGMTNTYLLLCSTPFQIHTPVHAKCVALTCKVADYALFYSYWYYMSNVFCKMKTMLIVVNCQCQDFEY